jgi:phospholipid transport system substrate-binding protein
MNKVRFSTLSALLLGSTLIMAGAPVRAASPVAAPVQALDQALDAIQQTGSGDFAARTAKLGPVIDQTYDLENVLRSSIGAARYMQLSADEKLKLLSTFRDYTIARYLSSFKPGSGAKFTLSPDVRPSSFGSDQIVTTHIGSDENMPGTEVDYIVRQENGQWKIVDVLLTGHISQAAAQRSDFGSTLASGGVDGLIEVLNKKVKSFAEN